MYERNTYRIAATKKRTGEYVEGTTEWDGLASLYFVEQADGTQKCVSVLDNITRFERVS